MSRFTNYGATADSLGRSIASAGDTIARKKELAEQIKLKEMQMKLDDNYRRQTAKADADYRSQMLDFQKADQVFKQEVRKHNMDMQTLAKESASKDDIYKSRMLENSIERADQDMVFKGTTLYGGNPYTRDNDGKLKLISAVIKNKQGQYEANPEAILRGIQVDVENKRFVTLPEIQSLASVEGNIEKKIKSAMGLTKAQTEYGKGKAAKEAIYDDFLLDPDERGGITGLGFDEEDAINNLYEKRNNIASTIDLYKVLPKDDPKRLRLLSELIALKRDMQSDRYEVGELTEWDTWFGGGKMPKKKEGLMQLIDKGISSLQ
tara:strand:+ start:308 stop:1267 length:960 start_codon:yes stop_codon:yes gene_type:complete